MFITLLDIIWLLCLCFCVLVYTFFFLLAGSVCVCVSLSLSLLGGRFAFTKFPFLSTHGTRVAAAGQPGWDALEMKGVSTPTPNHGTFIPGILDTRCYPLKGRLTNPTNFVLLSRVPRPIGHPVPTTDPDPQPTTTTSSCIALLLVVLQSNRSRHWCSQRGWLW